MRTGIIFLLIVMAVLCNGCVLAKAQNYAELNWLGDNDPDTRIPVTCGVPWPRAVHKKDTSFKVVDGGGNDVDAGSWPLGYWPDGSVKFTGITIAADSKLQMPLKVVPGENTPEKTLTVKENYDNIIIKTGRGTYDVNTKGDRVIESVDYDGRIVAEHLRVIVEIVNTPDFSAKERVVETYVSQFAKCSLEQNLPARAVIKAEGKFKCKETGRELFPFVMRLYFVAGVDTVETQFTFIYDGDE